MTDKIVVLSTCASEEEAGRLARMLVERRLAACVNVVPRVRSYYRWKGQVETADEWLLVVKSARPLFREVAVAIGAAHSYEVPETIAIPVVEGTSAYLDWLGENLGGGGSE